MGNEFNLPVMSTVFERDIGGRKRKRETTYKQTKR